MVLDLVRNKTVTRAYSILDRTPRRASLTVKKLIQSAADAAVKNNKENVEDLFISKITADGAGMLKRWRAMSMGRAGQIQKRLSHIAVELDKSRVKAAQPAVVSQKPAEAKTSATAGTKKATTKKAAAGTSNKKLAGAAK